LGHRRCTQKGLRPRDIGKRKDIGQNKGKTLIGTYQDPSAGSQKIMEVGTIIGDKAYSVQYIADAPRYSDYLPIVQKMIDSLVIYSR
jgi:hypothetical protein